MATLMDIVKKGSTDRSVTIRIIDSTDGTPETGVTTATGGLDLWYRREGAAKTSITEVALATPALTDAHSDGGFLHISDGEYRLDLPDAAFATGANFVDIGGTVTNMIVLGGRVKLVNYDPEDTVRLGLTALPNAAAEAAGGLYTRGSGAGQIAQSNNGQVDVDVKRVNGTNQTAGDIFAALTTIATYIDTEVASILSAVDTEVGAIKAKTDQLTFTVANQVDANMLSLADNVITAAKIAADAITAAKIAADAITAAKIATGAIDADALAADAVAEIADGVWDEAASGHVSPGTFGGKMRVIYGTAQGAGTGSNTLQLAVGQVANDGDLDDMVICLVGGTGAGQQGSVASSDQSDNEIVITGAAWAVTPDNTTRYIIFGN